MNRRWAIAFLLLAGLTSTQVANAQDRGTRDEAIAMVKSAIDHVKKVGPEKAFKDFTQDKATWTKKDLYIIVFDSKNIGLAHGQNDKIVGKDLTTMKDANGLVVVVGMNKIASTKGSGWFDYDWPHPQTKKIELKSTYLERLPSGDGFLGVGVYR